MSLRVTRSVREACATVGELEYLPLEPLRVMPPVYRVPWVAAQCRDKHVLDLGCYDETALAKRGTEEWLHAQIGMVARSVLGVDNSREIPPGGISTGPNSRIVRGDVSSLTSLVEGIGAPVDVIVAGELIEHLPDTLNFLRSIKQQFPGKELIATTPNATSLTNALLALANRESSHRDHLQIYSYKTLSTLCRQAGLLGWSILPYHMYYTEMALRNPRFRWFIRSAERIVNLGEAIFPLLSGGLILHVRAL